MRARNLSLLALTALLLSGCAPHASLLVWRPAAEEIQGVHKLAILDLDGDEPSGRIARGALEAQFAANRHYTLVDPAVLGPARSVQNGEGTTDVSAALAAAKSAGVDAILTGQVVSYKVDDDEQSDTHFSFGGNRSSKMGSSVSVFGVGIDKNQTVTREGSVSLSVKVIDVQSQRVIAVRQASHHVTAQQVKGEGNLPARERVLTELLTACAKDVVSLIAPHYAPAEVTLAQQYYGKGSDEVRRGNEFAKQGDWAGASASWESAVQENPANHAALHNLAVAAEARHDFTSASKNLNKALASYPATLYRDTQKRLREEQTLYLAASRQVDAQRSAPSLAQQTSSAATVTPASHETPSRLPPAE